MRVVLLRDQVIDGEPVKANAWIEVGDEEGYRLCAKGRAEPFPHVRALYDNVPLEDLVAAEGDVAEVHPDVRRIRCEVVKDCEAVACVEMVGPGFIFGQARKAGDRFEVPSDEAIALICEGAARYAPPPRGEIQCVGSRGRTLPDGRIEITETWPDGRGGTRKTIRTAQDWSVDRSLTPFITEEGRRMAAVYAD